MLDLLSIFVALVGGLLARGLGLPALVGYLAAGFALHELGVTGSHLLDQITGLGITLLLFTIGLKLRPTDLLETKVWGTASVHMAVSMGVFVVLLLAVGGWLPSTDITTNEALVIAFAMTFSSTVFAIQVLQERGEAPARHANLSIGVLLVQDIAAVLFIAGSTGKVPEWAAVGLLLLIPLRPLVIRLLRLAGHGELFTLFGLALAIGGAQLFELVDVKGDLGALILGALLARDRKAKELANNLMHFKDLFLVGFFVNIGLSGWPGKELVLIAVLAGLLAPLKVPLFYWLMSVFKTPPRTAVLGSATLGNYSEFGLIVVAIAAGKGLADSDWTAAFSLAIAISFLLSSAMNVRVHEFYNSRFHMFRRRQSGRAVRESADVSGAEVVVLGMGRIGTGAYRAMREHYGNAVLGVDDDDKKLSAHRAEGHRVVAGDASDPAFWANLDLDDVKLVMLALTNHDENMRVGHLLREMGYGGRVTAVTRFVDDEKELRSYGISSFNLYVEAGAGFAAAAHADSSPDGDPEAHHRADFG